ncbi:twitch domain-containing radical SAM protein [Lacrimispora brassicae]
MRSQEQIIDLFKLGQHFCVLPWVHLYASKLGNMSPCCQQAVETQSLIYGNLNEYSFIDLWDGEAIRDFRLRLLNDERCECCINCYEHENANIRSLRKLSNSKYEKYFQWIQETDENGFSANAKPIYWDLRFSNRCNLQCRTCSDCWILGLDAVADSPEPSGIIDTHKFFNDLDCCFPAVEELFFAGGEPLLLEENLLILEKLDHLQKHDVHLIYNTNFTKIDRFIILWQKFTNITLLISLDGSYEKCEYLRKGLNWEKIKENLRLLKKECPNISIIIDYTVSAFNILHLPDFHKQMVEDKYIKVDEFYLNVLNEPGFYNIRILPEEIKQLAVQKIKEHISWMKAQLPFNHTQDQGTLIKRKYFISKWHSCLNYMNGKDWSHLIPQFLEYTNKIDTIRNEHCLDIFPELKPIFEKKK